MISVLCPSRGRPDSLIRSIVSLLTTADDVSNIEILVAADPDDAKTMQVQCTATTVWTAPERYGYFDLNKYCDALAAQAHGEWLMLWNDDAIMKSKHWDTIIQARKPALLWATVNHTFHAATFSIWPKSWFDAMGYTAPTMHIDTYLHHLSKMTGLVQKIPVTIYHDRFDVTGNADHDDETYAEGRKQLGPEGMHGEFPYRSLNDDAAKILAIR